MNDIYLTRLHTRGVLISTSGIFPVYLLKLARANTAAAAVYTTLRGVQEIYCASISNTNSAVAGTRNIISGAEPFILWLPGL